MRDEENKIIHHSYKGSEKRNYRCKMEEWESAKVSALHFFVAFETKEMVKLLVMRNDFAVPPCIACSNHKCTILNMVLLYRHVVSFAILGILTGFLFVVR